MGETFSQKYNSVKLAIGSRFFIHITLALTI